MKQVVSVPSQLGPVLKSARRASGLSQAELAVRMDMSQSRISHMELNPGSMSIEQMLALSGLLGLEVVVQSRGGSAATGSARTPEW